MNAILSDELRIAEWFNKWGNPLRRWVGHRFNLRPPEIDDVVQETFVKILRYSLHTSIEHPQTYLFKIATNVVIESSERHRNKLPHDHEWLNTLLIDPSQEPEHLAENRSYGILLDQALMKLTHRQKTIFLMHHKHDLTNEEIANRLNLTLRVVKRDLENSKTYLRDLLSETDI